MPRWQQTIEDRILNKVVVNPETACWVWTGLMRNKLYGGLNFKKSRKLAHRVSYETFVGPIPKGLVIDHLCRETRCVNPHHLQPVSNKENILRGSGHCSVNSKKTHCKRGHEFTPENTRLYKQYRDNNRRECIECKKMHNRKGRKHGS